jgi:type I restriction-modification system DNA methylase subunit
MNLFNKKILNQRIANFSFPKGEEAEDISKLITGWQKALKDSDLSKTKEKSIQGKFLNVFFEQILGYEDKTGGKEEWSLIAEPKTEVDAQTADGSIGFFTKDDKKTVGVIELKDAKTSLDKKQKGREKGYSPVEQGYLYATKFDRCKWIIVSNFREIRIYNKARSEQFYEKFYVLDLHNEDEFKKFYFLLHKDNLIAKKGDSPIDDLAKKSTDQEEDISKKFYSDYKDVRSTLFEHLSKHNKDIDKKVLFEKSQKILDRIVFILFCEDTANLLPKNILRETYQFGTRSRQRSDEKVWLEIKNLFIDIDEGRDDIDPKINGYNGGLFKLDTVLDNLSIKDDIWEQVIKLSDYDFETDLNVNILGHIFEQSISDIESLKAEIDGEDQDKSKSKRKKDGIFYTPEYITKYIVENTVGKYLEEHPDKLEEIKILDPACGSGAFLNQAHSYLINEYKVRHEQKLIEKEKKGEALTLFDYNPAEANRGILLNNLYGVDLNDESVEITKLSLWLKTARKDEPLQNLDNNIKVGNSLIDDPEVAGEKAFKWKKEYKDIMKDGGFDVIIGNPPYVGQKGNSELFKPFQDGHWEWFYERKQDLYYYFFVKSIQLLREGGILGFIVPSYWLAAKGAEKLRHFISDNCVLEKVLDISDQDVFDGVGINASIFILKKTKDRKKPIYIEKPESLVLKNSLKSAISNSELSEESWNIFMFDDYIDITNKVEHLELGDLCNLSPGIQTGADKVTRKHYLDGLIHEDSINEGIYVIDNTFKEKLNPKERSLAKPYFKNSDISRYYVPNASDDNIIISNLIDDIEQYPHIKKHLLKYKKILDARYRNFALKNSDQKGRWWDMYGYRPNTNFDGSKIIFPYRSSDSKFAYTDKPFYSAMDIYFITELKDNYDYLGLLGILNSKLMTYYFKSNMKRKGKIIEFSITPMKKVPIPKSLNPVISQLTKTIVKKKREMQETIDSVNEILGRDYLIKILKQHFEGWNTFLDHFEINGIKLSMMQKEELQQWFKKKQKEVLSLQDKIDKLNKDIDQEVYKLYGLTKKEIAVIEGSV